MLFEIFANDAAGWVIVLLLFGGVLLLKEYREDRSLLIIYWFVLFLHLVVSLTNAYFFSTIGASGDAAQFYADAVELSSYEFFNSPSMLEKNYEHMLGLLFRVFSPSLFFGQQLSILAFSLSFFVLVKFITILDLKDHRSSILLMFGSLPSMVFYGSITLRESYEILFFMSSVYLIFRYYQDLEFRYLFGGLVCVLVMGTLAYALMFYAIYLIFFVLLFKVVFITNRKYLLSFLSALCVVVFVIVFWQKNIIIDTIVNNKLVHFINEIRATGSNARAYYGIALDTSSVLGAIRSLLMMLIYYLFSPFPWQITTIQDFYGLAESILRLVLIIFSFNLWFNTKGFNRCLVAILLFFYFSMSFLWAVGTINYGTLSRHNIVHFWIVVLIGIPGFIRFFKKKRFLYFLKN